jgi:chemotaxis response regulator CheB
MMTKASLRVLIVDDAVVFRRGISDMLSDVPYIEVLEQPLMENRVNENPALKPMP